MKRNKMPDTSRWTVEDWRDLWESMEAVKDRIRARHGIDETPAEIMVPPATGRHTPGPWKLHHVEGCWRWVSDQAATWTRFALVCVVADNETSEMGEANARLIRYSPDLLAMCQLVIDTLSQRVGNPFAADDRVLMAKLKELLSKVNGDWTPTP